MSAKTLFLFVRMKMQEIYARRGERKGWLKGEFLSKTTSQIARVQKGEAKCASLSSFSWSCPGRIFPSIASVSFCQHSSQFCQWPFVFAPPALVDCELDRRYARLWPPSTVATSNQISLNAYNDYTYSTAANEPKSRQWFVRQELCSDLRWSST